MCAAGCLGSCYTWRSQRLVLTGHLPPFAACSWTIPSNIPVSAFGGQSLFGLFTQQIGAELAHFPTGPSIDSPFWLYMITWHMGLFACIFWCVHWSAAAAAAAGLMGSSDSRRT